MGISKVKWNFLEIAKKYNQHFLSLPLKDKSTANFLWDEHSFDCYIVKKGKLVGAKGMRGSSSEKDSQLLDIIIKLQELVKPGVDVINKFTRASLNIYK